MRSGDWTGVSRLIGLRMSPVSNPFDVLMDRLAALAVEAVQVSATAVQAYWLCLASAMLQHDPSSCLSLETLAQQAWLDGSLDEWMRPVAPQALLQLLRAGDLLVGQEWPRLPKRAPVTWEAMALSRGCAIWVSPVYQPYVADLQEQTCRLWQATRRLYGVRSITLQKVPEEIARGTVLFDAGFYFACHEYFETLWGRTGDVASAFYQGLIQVAVAMRHLESHQVRGAVTLLHNGLGRLRDYPSTYKGLPLGRFREEVAALLHSLQTLPNAARYQFDASQMPRLLDDME
jgi:predicted metal-dependent hydrolase